MGLAGVATYAVERLSRRDSPGKSAEQLLGLIVDRLYADAEEMDSGISWLTRPELLSDAQRELTPSGHYNLGVAHGVPALVVILAHAVARGISVDRARRLLEGAITWITLQQSQSGEGARFPAWVASETPERLPGSREAWCYGGLGLAVALVRAADVLGGAAWEETALTFARLEATRSAAGSGVTDFCLCHGAGGNAHLYNRLYQATGEKVFLAAAHRGINRVLRGYKPSEASGGFLFWRAEPGGAWRWHSDDSFLSGSAGVALALLAGAGTQAPEWDRLFLVDLSVGGVFRRRTDRDSAVRHSTVVDT